MAAPVDAQPTGHPKWINPCGLPPSAAQNPNYAELESEMASDYHNDELMERIIVTARNALMHAQGFRDEYVRKTFNQGFSQFHDTWKTRRYDWLPNDRDIPKNLGERVPQEYLDNLKIETALRNAFQILQKFAVGLEQVVWDQSVGSNFKKAFEDAEFKLRATLCEVQVTLLETNVKQPYDVERDIMDDRIRVMNDVSLRNLRDWVIYRDYMNGLEYIIQVFEYFKNK